MILNALIVTAINTLLYFNLHDKLINDKQEKPYFNGKGFAVNHLTNLKPPYITSTIWMSWFFLIKLFNELCPKYGFFWSDLKPVIGDFEVIIVETLVI